MQKAQDPSLRIYHSAKHIRNLRHIGVTPISSETFDQTAYVASKSDITFDAVGGTLASYVLSYMKPDTDFISYGLLSGQSITMSPTGPAPQRFHLRNHITATTSPEWQQGFREL